MLSIKPPQNTMCNHSKPIATSSRGIAMPSGEAEQALRYNEGKLEWTQVDFKSLEELVRVLEYGAKKYGKGNWRKGLPITQISESLLRHLFAFLDGEDDDEESGLSHIGHILANAMFLNYVHKNKPEFDDRRK